METVYDYNQNGFSSIFPAHGTTINIDETNNLITESDVPEKDD